MIISGTAMRLARVGRKLWVRAALFSLLGVVTALLSAVVAPYIPYDFTVSVGAEAVDNILGILASSMLTVTTFSLTTMVSAFSAVTNNATPRATTLLMEDRTAQNAIATFLGTFLFSIVGIIALSTGFYGQSGRVVLFIVTILVILWIVVTLLRWIEHLSQLGRLGETIERVERQAAQAMANWIETPCLGGRREDRAPPEGAHHVRAAAMGYVQHLDVALLAEVGEELGVDIHLHTLPGAYLHGGRPLVWLDRAPDEQQAERIRSAFTIGEARSFEQDPRFGLIVLEEIGSRALSAAINDSGTVLAVMNAGARILASLAEAEPPADGPRYPNVVVPDLDPDDLFDDFFRPLARDGAAIVEVGIRLQKILAQLADAGDGRFAEVARRHAGQALARARQVMTFQPDIAALERASLGRTHE